MRMLPNKIAFLFATIVLVLLILPIAHVTSADPTLLLEWGATPYSGLNTPYGREATRLGVLNDTVVVLGDLSYGPFIATTTNTLYTQEFIGWLFEGLPGAVPNQIDELLANPLYPRKISGLDNATLTSLVADQSGNWWALDTSGQTYLTSHPPPVDSFGYSRRTTPNGLDFVPVAFGNDTDNDGPYVMLKSSGSISQLVTYAVTASGKLYVRAPYYTNCVQGYGYTPAFANSSIPPVDLPPLTSDSIVTISNSRGYAIINNSVYAWGYFSAAGSPLPNWMYCAQRAFDMTDDLNSTHPNATWVHAFPSSFNDPSYFIAQDGTVVVMASSGISIEPNLTALIQSGPNGRNASFLVQIELTSSGLFLLMADGSLWTYIRPGYSASWDIMADISASQTGLVLNHFGAALPPNYQVYRIMAAASSCAALARPISSTNTTIPPVFSPTDPKTSVPLVWDVVVGAAAPGFNLKDTYENRYLAQFVDMSHFTAATANFSEIAFTNTHALYLGADGSVYATSSYPTYTASSPIGNSINVDGMLSAVSGFDPRTLLGQKAVTIAVGDSDSLVLLQNGTIMAFGSSFDNVLPPVSFPLANGSFYTDPATFSRAVYYPSNSSVTFTSIYAFDKLFAALDTVGRLYTFGQWSNAFDWVSTDLHDTPNLFAGLGVVKHFAFGSECAWMIIENATNGTRSIVYAAPAVNSAQSELNDTSGIYYVPDFSASTLNVSKVVQMVAYESFAAFLTSDGQIYGITPFPTSTFANWTKNATTGELPLYPVLLPLTGIPSNIKKIALINSGLYIIDNSGNLFASAVLDRPSINFAPNVVAPFLPGYHVTNIASCSGTMSCTYKLVLASPVVNQTKDTSIEYMSLLFGWSQAATAISSIQVDPSNGFLRVLPDGHPLDSPTLSNVTVGFLQVDCVDGAHPVYPFYNESLNANISFSNATIPRYLSWGFIGIITQDAQYTLPNYLSQQIMERADEIVAIIPFQLSFHAIFYDNGAIEVVSVPWYTAIQLNPTMTYYGGALNVSQDQNYSRTFVLPYQNDLVSIPALFDNSSSPEEPITQVRWSDMYFEPATTIDPGSDVNGFWAVLLTQNTSALYVSSMFSQYQSVVQSYELFGTYEESWNATIMLSANYDWYTLQRRLSSYDAVLAANPWRNVQISVYNGIVLHQDGNVSTWGFNDRGQLGVDVNTVKASCNPHFIDFSAHSGFRATQVVSITRAFLAVNTTSILAWGDNTFGLLGNGATWQKQLYAHQPVAVLVPAGPFSKVICSSYACYALYPNGDLYTWGASAAMSLGRHTASSYDPLPQLASALQFPGPYSRKIVDIFTSVSTGAVIVRGLRGLAAPVAPPPVSPPPVPITPPPSDIPCVGEPPLPSFFCVNGTWVGTGVITIGGGNGSSSGSNNTFTISGPTFINGSLIVAPGATVVFTVPTINNTVSDLPLLNVSGCFVLNGTLNIGFDQSSWDSVKNTLNGHLLTVVESSCVMLNTTLEQDVTTPADCKKAKTDLSNQEHTGGRYSLISTFLVSNSACNRWWIILVAVLGSVVILAAAGAVVIVIIRANKLSRRPLKIRTQSTF